MTLQVEGKFGLHRFFYIFLEAELWKERRHSKTITRHTMKTRVWLPSVVCNRDMVEFLTTIHYVEKYLKPGMRILEIGAAPVDILTISHRMSMAWLPWS